MQTTKPITATAVETTPGCTQLTSSHDSFGPLLSGSADLFCRSAAFPSMNTNCRLSESRNSALHLLVGFVDVAPGPILSRLDGLHYGMAAVVEMLGGVAAG
jgi:hypothetical protein